MPSVISSLWAQQIECIEELRGLSRIWNLSLPVLVTKWAPYFIPSSADLEALNRAPPVRALAAAGVRRLRYATAALYRPWCLWPLSSDAQKERRANLTKWAHEELGFLERHVNQHAAVTAAGAESSKPGSGGGGGRRRVAAAAVRGRRRSSAAMPHVSEAAVRGRMGLGK